MCVWVYVCVCVCACACVSVYLTPPNKQYMTQGQFICGVLGLNSEFSISLTSCYTKAKVVNKVDMS